MHRGRVDRERPTAAARRQLIKVLSSQIHRARLIPAESTRLLKRPHTLLRRPDALRVANVPDHHPTHHLDHAVQRQIVVVDPLLNVREDTQDGVFRIPDQDLQLLIRDRDGAGAEPPVTHILRCRPRHDSALLSLHRCRLSAAAPGSARGRIPGWIQPLVLPRFVFLDELGGHLHPDALRADQPDTALLLADLRHQLLLPTPKSASSATNASTSATTHPYSASASTATKLCSHREVSWLLMVTVASVETRKLMPPTAPHAVLRQSPAKPTTSPWATPSPMNEGRLSSRPGRARAPEVSSVGSSVYSGRPVESTAPHSSGSTLSSSAQPVSRLPVFTSSDMASTRSAWMPPCCWDAEPRVTACEVSTSASLNGPDPVPSPPTSYRAARSNATANASARCRRKSTVYPPGLARATSADMTAMAANFFGSMDSRSISPLVAGFCPPSETQLAVGLPVVIGIALPLMGSGTRRDIDITTDCRAASSKIGSEISGGRKPSKSEVLVGAVIAIVLFLSLGSPYETPSAFRSDCSSWSEFSAGGVLPSAGTYAPLVLMWLACSAACCARRSARRRIASSSVTASSSAASSLDSLCSRAMSRRRARASASAAACSAYARRSAVFSASVLLASSISASRLAAALFSLARCSHLRASAFQSVSARAGSTGSVGCGAGAPSVASDIRISHAGLPGRRAACGLLPQPTGWWEASSWCPGPRAAGRGSPSSHPRLRRGRQGTGRKAHRRRTTVPARATPARAGSRSRCATG